MGVERRLDWRNAFLLVSFLIGFMMIAFKITFESQWLGDRSASQAKLVLNNWESMFYDNDDDSTKYVNENVMFKTEIEEMKAKRKRRNIDEKDLEYNMRKRHPELYYQKKKTTTKGPKIFRKISPEEQKPRSKRSKRRGDDRPTKCVNEPQVCIMELVETIPMILTTTKAVTPLDRPLKSTLDVWLELIRLTREQLEVTSQWSIIRDPTGQDLFNAFRKALEDNQILLKFLYTEKKRSLAISPKKLHKVSPELARLKKVQNISNVVDRGGVLHSKLFMSDRKNFYMGSGNVGHRCALATKEMGVYVKDCPVLADDLSKIFELYWRLDTFDELPERWPKAVATTINAGCPLPVYNPLDNTFYGVYIGASPAALNGEGRSDDLTGILRLIDQAERFIYICVGEYLPQDVYKDQKPWIVIDHALRHGEKFGI